MLKNSGSWGGKLSGWISVTAPGSTQKAHLPPPAAAWRGLCQFTTLLQLSHATSSCGEVDIARLWSVTHVCPVGERVKDKLNKKQLSWDKEMVMTVCGVVLIPHHSWIQLFCATLKGKYDMKMCLRDFVSPQKFSSGRLALVQTVSQWTTKKETKVSLAALKSYRWRNFLWHQCGFCAFFVASDTSTSHY